MDRVRLRVGILCAVVLSWGMVEVKGIGWLRDFCFEKGGEYYKLKVLWMGMFGVVTK